MKGFIIVKIVGKLWTGTWMGQSISKIGQRMPIAYRWTPVDLKVPSPLVEAGIEEQACLGLYRFHEADINNGYLSYNSAGQMETFSLLGQTMSFTEDGKKTFALQQL